MNEQYYIILDVLINELTLHVGFQLEFFKYFQLFLKLSKLSIRYNSILKPKFDELCIEINPENIFQFWNNSKLQIYIHRFACINHIQGLDQLNKTISHKCRELQKRISDKYSMFNINTDIFNNISLKLSGYYNKEKHSMFGFNTLENKIIEILTEDDIIDLISLEYIYQIFENYKVEYIYKYEKDGIHKNYVECYDTIIQNNYIQLCDIAPGVNYYNVSYI